MSLPSWLTPAGDLGIIPEGTYYETQLDAFDSSGAALTYKKIAGVFPDGIQLTKTGLLIGIPIVSKVSAEIKNYTSTFTIRITNNDGAIADRTFSLTISNIIPPDITPPSSNLGSFYDGSYVSIQLQAIEINPNAVLTWSISGGNFPPQLSLNPTTGLISGYLFPTTLPGDAGNGGWDLSQWDLYYWDFLSRNETTTFSFTVQAFDGLNYDKTNYTITVLSKNELTADNDISLINNTQLTVDVDNLHNPVLLTSQTSLPTIRQESNFAFQFTGLDFDGDTINFGSTTGGSGSFDQAPYDTVLFDQGDLAFPPGLSLDPVTGWLTGKVGSINSNSQTYNFTIYCFKENNPTYISIPISFSLTILGSVNNEITWVTNSNLGTIENGSVSEFQLVASNPTVSILHYQLLSGSDSKLPQGLTLLDNGLITGRTSFEYFSLDKDQTTFDNKQTTFDSNYIFTVIAFDTQHTTSATKTFNIKVVNRNVVPYENLYLTALPLLEQREFYSSIIQNPIFFPNDLIYRNQDPFFGKSAEPKFLFLAGIHPASLESYIYAMGNNHFNKKIQFGDIKTAVSLDENFNVKYEVVYIEMIDNDLINDTGPNTSIDLSNIIENGYIPETDSNKEYKIAYPNSFKNMQKQIENHIGYSNQGALPGWMTSRQPNGKVLGFVRGIVLAYTVPGGSSLIKYRLTSNNIRFNEIDCTVDRYELDNYLSTDFDIDSNTFVTSTETTFDRVPSGTTAYPLVATVNYAVNMAFNMINNIPVSILNSNNGIDGIKTFSDGDTLVFAQQEFYTGETDSNDGWINYQSIYDGDKFDSDNFNSSQIIPGYLENLLDSSVSNERSGVWRINIVNGLVKLTLVQLISLGQSIYVLNGNSYSSTKLFYDPIVKTGKTVPDYSILSSINQNSGNYTRFDGGSTKFIEDRVMYAAPGVNNKYLKFPGTNVLEQNIDFVEADSILNPLINITMPSPGYWQ